MTRFLYKKHYYNSTDEVLSAYIKACGTAIERCTEALDKCPDEDTEVILDQICMGYIAISNIFTNMADVNFDVYTDMFTEKPLFGSADPTDPCFHYNIARRCMLEIPEIIENTCPNWSENTEYVNINFIATLADRARGYLEISRGL